MSVILQIYRIFLLYLSYGIITTTSITHPSVAATYGVSTNSGTVNKDTFHKRNTDDASLDLASQLMQHPGMDFKVILGGGRKYFLTNKTTEGSRGDGQNLVAKWIKDKQKLGREYQYVTTKDQLAKVNEHTEYLLGLFHPEKFNFHLEANENQPSLEEMTKAALKILSKSKNGYFLFILGGRIHDAHMQNKAAFAVDETIELSRAINTVNGLTNPSDTLVIVTADHGSTMTYNGYVNRWSDALGPVEGTNTLDKIPHMGVSYANGPGYLKEDSNGARKDPTKELLFAKGSPHYSFPSTVLLEAGTAGGEDVALYARGPGARLLGGSRALPEIAVAMACILQVGPGCPSTSSVTAVSGTETNAAPRLFTLLSIFVVLVRYVLCY